MVSIKSRIDWKLVKEFKAQGKTNKEIADYFDIKVLTFKDYLTQYLKTNEMPGSLKDKYGTRHVKDESYFQEITNPTAAYILGWLISDGSISSNYLLRIELGKIDSSIVKLVRDELAPSVELRFCKREKEYKEEIKILETCIFDGKCKQWFIDLQKYYMIPNKTQLEIKLATLPEELMKHYIRGLFEGNGTISKRADYNTTTVSIKFGSNTLVSELGKYLNQKGIIKKPLLSSKSSGTNSYFITFANKIDVFNFFHYIYSDIPDHLYLPRKREKYHIYIAT